MNSDSMTRARNSAGQFRTLLVGVCCICAWLTASTRLAAQVSESPDHTLRLPAPRTMEDAARGTRATPGVSISIPSAYGAGWGHAAAGFGFQATTRLHNRPDGVLAFTLGFGDARELAGLEVTASSYGTARSCCRGGLSFKVHRLLPWSLGVAAGWENGAVWRSFSTNDNATDGGHSFYGVATKTVYLRPGMADPYTALTLTLGAGNGRFRSEQDIIYDHAAVNAFGGVALRMGRSMSVLADWTGQDLVAGISVLPLRNSSFIVVPGVADITTKPRFVLGAGIGFDYGSILNGTGRER